ncbi:OmpA family protein [Fodinibius salsisoli]|uniref:OmpA family protein n=1 Tax=Fodinibius salsisoli TaxID=2820877 RepID=A0ABT3PRC0_9BACT|nr:OmpA family protein [Fodinibius salsisoli]MCW9708412.1 OmpA family protein [Fodinibius salsisoli]
MLKKLLLAATMLCLFVPAMQAQTDLNRTWLSIHVGHNEYDGDLGNEMLEYELKSDWAGGIGFHQYLSPSFDFDAVLTYGYLDYKNGEDGTVDPNPVKANNSFGTKYLNANLMLRYKLANGYIFGQNAALQPFLAAGVGVTPYFGGSDNIYFGESGNDIESRVGFGVPLAAGFDIPLSKKTKIILKATYNRTFVDGFDGQAEGLGRSSGGIDSNIDNKDHDDFLVTSVGFKFNVGGAKDTDGDGIIDSEDACPEEVGTEANNGCPDTDRDGIIDKEDDCPEVAGEAEFNGCPDSDGDGIIDSEDACPEVAGEAEFDGCPDSDGDGIVDSEDACPEVAGEAEFDGCPDTDGDGIVDSEDECPEVAGTEANNGCPQVDFDFADVNFGFDQSIVEDEFKADLDRLAEELMDDTNLQVTLTGHADRIGTEQYNLRLSQRRAESVKNYLVGQGVSADRIFTKGVGETEPLIQDADTQERRQNRRVVIEVSRM